MCARRRADEDADRHENTGWTLAEGTRIGGRRVERVLGSGATGCVVLARGRSRIGVLKVIRPELSDDPHLEERIRRELARLLRVGDNPHRVRPGNVRRCKRNGCVHVAMPYIEGPSLEEHLAEHGPMSAGEARRIFLAVVEGMRDLHRIGIPHRDIHPGNIILGGEGAVVLVDLGFAAIEDAARRTDLFAAPELALGAQADPRSDVYSIAASLHHAVTYGMRRNAPAPDELRQVLMSALSVDPELRPADADELHEALQRPPSPARTPLFRKLFGRVVDAEHGPYHTLGEAVRTVQPGERIRVRPGVYRETLWIHRDVHIVGEGPRDEVVLECPTSSIYLSSGRATLRGLTIRHAAEFSGADAFALDISRGIVRIDQCDISSNSLAAVGVHGPQAYCILRDCTIHDAKQGGIFLYENAVGDIERCDVSGNKLAGIEVKTGAYTTIRHCVMHDGQSGGAFFHDKGAGVVEDCELHGNGLVAVEIKSGADVVVRRCNLHDGKQGGVMVWEKAIGLVEHCDMLRNGLAAVEIRAGGNPLVRHCRIRDNKQSGIYVHTSGAGLIEHCDIAGSGLGGIAIKQDGDPLIRRCTIHDGKEGGVYVYEKGAGRIEHCDIFGNGLAGVQVREAGRVVVVHCRIHDGKQGGVYVNDSGEGTIEHCDIFANSLSGVQVRTGGNPVVRDCRIHDNRQAGVFGNEDSTGLIERCEIFTNGFAGVETKENGNLRVVQCLIRDGKQSGVFIHEKGNGVFEDCDITGNAEEGVEIRKVGMPTLKKCRIRRNRRHGIRIDAESGAVVHECDLTENDEGAWSVDDGAVVERQWNVE